MDCIGKEKKCLFTIRQSDLLCEIKLQYDCIGMNSDWLIDLNDLNVWGWLNRITVTNILGFLLYSNIFFHVGNSKCPIKY